VTHNPSLSTPHIQMIVAAAFPIQFCCEDVPPEDHHQTHPLVKAIILTKVSGVSVRVWTDLYTKIAKKPSPTVPRPINLQLESTLETPNWGLWTVEESKLLGSIQHHSSLPFIDFFQRMPCIVTLPYSNDPHFQQFVDMRTKFTIRCLHFVCCRLFFAHLPQ
jgi:hypothetical protein